MDKINFNKNLGTIAGNIEEYPNYYYLPMSLKGSKEIINAIELLNITKDEEISDMYLMNKEKKLQTEELEITNSIEFLITEYLNGNDIKNDKNPFSKVSPEFLMKICKNKMNKENNQNFLNYLYKVKLLENNKIYEKLLQWYLLLINKNNLIYSFPSFVRINPFKSGIISLSRQ